MNCTFGGALRLWFKILEVWYSRNPVAGEPDTLNHGYTFQKHRKVQFHIMFSNNTELIVEVVMYILKIQ